MSRKAFNRFMVANDNGRNVKLARLTDAEFRAFIQGVLPIASEATPRGAFMVGNLPATAEDIVFVAPKVKIAAARSVVVKLRALGMLEHDDELGGEWVHDFDKLNPAPRNDPSNAERQARFRERRNAQRNAQRNAVSNAPRNAEVTPPEVEGEVEQPPLTPPGGNADLTVPVKPAGTRRRDLEGYEAAVDAFAVALLPGVPPVDAGRAVRSVLGRGTGFHMGEIDVIRHYAAQFVPGVRSGVAA